MTAGRLLLANLGRKKVRTALTLLSFVVATFLLGLLVVIDIAFSAGVDVAGVDRVLVINKISLIMPLPSGYKEKILQVEGAADVSHASWFGGVYQDPKNFFAQFAVPDNYLRLYPEFSIPDDQWQAFLSDRQGAVAGRTIADRFGWKVGDRIPLQGTIFPGTWEFNLRAIYDGTRQGDDTTQFWFRHAYFEERGVFMKGLVGWYIVRVARPEEALEVSRRIDARFANSSFETLTQTEKEFARSFANQMGNIRLLILVIGVVVLFTLLLVTGNTMAMAVRERTGELAVLKTLGFSDGQVMRLVLAEALFYAGVGGGAGILLAKVFTLGGDPTGGLLPFFYLPDGAIALGLGIALAVGFAAALIPALAARRLRVVEALRAI